MKLNAKLANEITEKGFVPDSLIRRGIRKLLTSRLDEIAADNAELMASNQISFISQMNNSSIALLPEKANEQHYEVPEAFFQTVLGYRLKYSCGFWDDEVENIHQSEERALQISCEHAEIENGMQILELGCGWGSLTFWMAEHYPDSHIVAVSNSASQGDFIRAEADKKGLANIEIVTADMNDFVPSRQFDRVVSVEMFEHMRNYEALYKSISSWLKPEGKLFKHIFVNRSAPYSFEDRDDSDWMSRHFFSGGMMPSDDLPLFFQRHLSIEKRWRWSGQHYEKTANAWLARMDANKQELWPLFESVYGKDFASMWWQRWRIFFMACAELFGYDKGQQWWVSHYLFSKR